MHGMRRPNFVAIVTPSGQNMVLHPLCLLRELLPSVSHSVIVHFLKKLGNSNVCERPAVDSWFLKHGNEMSTAWQCLHPATCPPHSASTYYINTHSVSTVFILSLVYTCLPQHYKPFSKCLLHSSTLNLVLSLCILYVHCWRRSLRAASS